MSLKVHSRILEVSRDPRSCGGTALAGRRSRYLTPPSWTRTASSCWSTLCSEECGFSHVVLEGSGSDYSEKFPGTGQSGDECLEELPSWFSTKHCQLQVHSMSWVISVGCLCPETLSGQVVVLLNCADHWGSGWAGTGSGTCSGNASTLQTRKVERVNTGLQLQNNPSYAETSHARLWVVLEGS